MLNVKDSLTWSKGNSVERHIWMPPCATVPQWEDDRSRRIAMFSVSVSAAVNSVDGIAKFHPRYHRLDDHSPNSVYHMWQKMVLE